MAARTRPFDALDNFRDYGDYGAGGRRIRTGRLYRSAHHADLSPADLVAIEDLGLGVVVDLRRPIERRRQPSKRPPGFDGRVIQSDLDEAGEAPHILFLKAQNLTITGGRDFMTGVYREMPFSPAHLEAFSAYFRALGEGDRPVLIHCTAGKDRTGLLAALTHRLLGVHPDDVLADYLLTNQAVDLEARAPDIARRLEAMTGRKAPHEAVVAFMGVEAAYLDAAMGAIATRHGSLVAYLEQALGVDAALRDRIAERLAA